ncbi:MAG: hypothetical protein STSR0008_02320 [Ignavibacterium sp.]
MKKIIVIILTAVFLFSSCEKDFDNIIDVAVNSYQVNSIYQIKDFTYSDIDTSIIIKISFDDIKSINSVWANVISSTNERINYDPIFLLDNGKSENKDEVANDKIFTNYFILRDDLPNGNFTVEYFVEETSNSTSNIQKKIGSQNFIFDNGKENFSPVLSNLNAPDTVTLIGESVLIPLSINASDSNGLNDIKEVYFITYRPNGTTDGSKTYLYDNGNAKNGDEIADDGIFSQIIVFTSSNTKGQWRFDFQAIDRKNKLSNIIQHYIVIQ